ncbi:MAG: ribonuclease D [Candidatus Hydrogenedens sp.]|nr:ribonuclease D [Candidatus Hydrogenedens sp.]
MLRSGKEPFILVKSPRSWERCLQELQKAPRLAVDLEANGLYAYREKICLIQISTDNCHYIVDPLSSFSLDGLRDILADENVEKVFHAVDYDLTLLKGLWQWELRGLFDTMRAAEMLGFQSIGLASLLQSFYGITLSKKFQKANWGLRPLSSEQLLYAYNDTCHLLRLRDDLAEQLEEADLMEEAHEAFNLICNATPAEREFDPDHFWRLPGVTSLSGSLRAVLKALFIFRDGEAKKQNLPPFKIMSNQMLLGLSKQAGKWKEGSTGSLKAEVGVPGRLLERYRAVLMKVIRQGLKDPHPVRPTSQNPHSNGFGQRLDALKEWRKKEAQSQGVQSHVVLPRATMHSIAEKNPESMKALSRIESLGPLCCRRYGESILEALREAAEEMPSGQ